MSVAIFLKPTIKLGFMKTGYRVKEQVKMYRLFHDNALAVLLHFFYLTGNNYINISIEIEKKG